MLVVCALFGNMLAKGNMAQQSTQVDRVTLSPAFAARVWRVEKSDRQGVRGGQRAAITGQKGGSGDWPFSCSRRRWRLPRSKPLFLSLPSKAHAAIDAHRTWQRLLQPKCTSKIVRCVCVFFLALIIGVFFSCLVLRACRQVCGGKRGQAGSRPARACPFRQGVQIEPSLIPACMFTDSGFDFIG
jgi:hypothetical protein